MGDAVEQEEPGAGSGCCRGAAQPAAPKRLLKSPGFPPSAGNIWKGEQSLASLSSAPLLFVKMRRLGMTQRSQEMEQERGDGWDWWGKSSENQVSQ